MQMQETFAAEADALLDRAGGQGDAAAPVDGVTDLAELYPLKVFPDAVGLEAEGRENLLLYGDMIFNAFGPRNELLASAAEQVAAGDGVDHGPLPARALRPGGFGDQIYQAADAGEISHDEAPMLVRSFLSAGVDTTINGLGNALLCLAQHPEQYAKLRADPSLARPAFEEALRYESTGADLLPHHLARHRARRRDASRRTARCSAFLAPPTATRGSGRTPDRFDIERRPSGHVAFGSGIHGCVGQAVARLEGELILGGAGQARRRASSSPANRRAASTTRCVRWRRCRCALTAAMTAHADDAILIQPDGTTRTIEVAAGTSVMQAAVGAGVRGIVGECGGSAMCATCHVYVDDAWRDKLPPPLADRGRRCSNAPPANGCRREPAVVPDQG